MDCDTNNNWNNFGFSWFGDLMNVDLSSTGLSYLPDSFCDFYDIYPYLTTHLDNNFLCPSYPECIENNEYINLGFQDCQDCSSFGDNFTYIDHSDVDDIVYLSETLDYNWFFQSNVNCYYQSDLDFLQDIINLNPDIHIITHPDGPNSLNGLVVQTGSLSNLHPIKLGSQVWENGRMKYWRMSSHGYVDPSSYSIVINSIPNSIGNLTFLESLSLHYNFLNTFLPDEICELQYLNNIYLHNNQLCSFHLLDCLSEEDIGYQNTSECGD